MQVLKLSAALLSSSALGNPTMPPLQTLLMPAFPPPVGLDTDTNFQSAITELSSSLRNALSQGSSAFGNFTPNMTSVSVSVKSTAQRSPLFDFQFTGDGLNTSAGSTSHVTGDSVFRIGSVSKLITVYALLLHNGLDHWEQPVTKYVPELLDYAQRVGNSSQIDHVSWEDVTIGALASQTSGIGSNCEILKRTVGKETRLMEPLQMLREIYPPFHFLGPRMDFQSSILRKCHLVVQHPLNRHVVERVTNYSPVLEGRHDC
jgi:CubicO group peptidase (beta-lactamase class C family)